MSPTDIPQIQQIVRLFREQQNEMPMQQADVLLTIARRPGLTMAELSEETNLAQSSCSRNVAALSDYHRLGSPGLGLVEAVIDPRNPRRRMMFLTAKGKVFVTHLMRVLDPTFSFDRATDAKVEVEKMHQAAAQKAKQESEGNKTKTRLRRGRAS